MKKRISHSLPISLFCFIYFLFPSTILAETVFSETLRIAVASNFVETAKLLANEYSEQSGQQVQISSGSSGKLYLQIKNGAPFDIFLSADNIKPQKLINNGLASAATRRTYALGKLSLWLKNCAKEKSIEKIFVRPFNKFAIANPKLAPYGFASQKFLENIDVYNALSPQLIYLENIAQVAQMAKLGVVDGALIAQSNIPKLNNRKNSCIIDIAVQDYPAIEQQLVVISNSKNKRLSNQFLMFLKTDHAQSLIKNMGYLLPKPVKIPPIE